MAGSAKPTVIPTALATWALLSEDAEARIIEFGIRKLAPADWKSGDRLWLMDLLVAVGNGDHYLNELRSTHPSFKDRKLKTLRPAPGGGMAVMEW